MADTILSKTGRYVAEGLEEPVPFSQSAFIARIFRKNKLRVFIIYEDMTFTEHFCKKDDKYVVTVDKHSYVKVPQGLLRGERPTLLYYFNNPMPIGFRFESSKLSQKIIEASGDEKKLEKVIRDADKTPLNSDVVIDARALNVALTSNLINKMYSEGGFNTKALIITLVVVFIILILVLHFTGVINIMEILTGKAMVRG